MDEARFEDLKEYLDTRFNLIENKIDCKCESCIRVAELKMISESHWSNILALWSMYLISGGGILTLGILLFKHLGEK
jgi:hypothetical protein